MRGKKTAQSSSEFVVIFQSFLYLLSSSSYTGVKPDLPVLLCAPRPVPALLSGFYHSHLLAPNSLPPRSSSSLWDPCRHRALPPHRRWRTTETQRIAAVQLFLVYNFFFYHSLQNPHLPKWLRAEHWHRWFTDTKHSVSGSDTKRAQGEMTFKCLDLTFKFSSCGLLLPSYISFIIFSENLGEKCATTP